MQAHHIFPEKFFGEGAEYANLLKDVGISYCDPRLLVWYDKSTHLSNVLKYNDDIYEVIVKYKDNLPEFIKGIREVARRYGFEPKF